MKSPKSSGKPKKPKKLIVVRRVNGNSMAPGLRHGQPVVGWSTDHLAVGDVVIVLHDGLEKVKRIRKRRDDAVYLLGDNPAYSTDSRQFGWVPDTSIIAKVIWPRLPADTDD